MSIWPLINEELNHNFEKLIIHKMKQEIKELEINGITYVPKSSIVNLAPDLEGKKFVLIRTYSAGVHFGYMESRTSTLAGIEVKLLQARRVYYWKGAATLSQMANEGVKYPAECKFTQPVQSIDLVAIEIIEITEKAFNNLNSVPVWQV